MIYITRLNVRTLVLTTPLNHIGRLALGDILSIGPIIQLQLLRCDIYIYIMDKGIKLVVNWVSTFVAAMSFWSCT